MQELSSARYNKRRIGCIFFAEHSNYLIKTFRFWRNLQQKLCEKLLEKKWKSCEIMLLKILVLTCLVFLPLGDGIKLGGGRGGTRGSGLNLGGGGRTRKQHTRKPGKPYFFNLLLFPELLWCILCLLHFSFHICMGMLIDSIHFVFDVGHNIKEWKAKQERGITSHLCK